MRRHQSGFTLIEVLAALVITALVALMAHRLMAVTLDGVRALAAATETRDRRENARRWLHEAFRSLQPDGEGGFEGRSDRVEFSSWLPVPEGWSAPARVTLTLDGTRLTAHASPGDDVSLGDSLAAVAFDYLLTPGARTAWVSVWRSPLSAPLGVRLRLLHLDASVDTILCLIGERG